MNRKAFAAAGVAVMAFCSSVSQAWAADSYVYGKAGADGATVVADMQTCVNHAARMPMASTPIFSPNLAVVLVGSVVTGVMAGVQRSKAMAVAEDACMVRLGYVRLDMTPEEIQDFSRARSRSEKQAWIRGFYTRDLTERLSKAQAGAPKMLPEIQDEPYAVGGVRLDPAQIQLKPGTIAEGQVLLTGVMRYRRTAVVDQAFEADNMLKVHFAAGTVLFAVDHAATDAETPSTLWCGPVKADALWRKDVSGLACVTNTNTGPVVRTGFSGTDWMVGDRPLDARSPVLKIVNGPVSLTSAADDQAAPMPFVMKVRWVDEDRFMLDAVATRDKHDVVFWSATLSFDAAGRAVLPFWGETLVITRAAHAAGPGNAGGGAVQAAMSPVGNGQGWLGASADASNPAKSVEVASGVK